MMTKTIALLGFLTACQLPTSLVQMRSPSSSAPASHTTSASAPAGHVELHGWIVQVQTDLEQMRSVVHRPSYTAEQCDEFAADNGRPEAKAVCVEYAKWTVAAALEEKLSKYAFALDIAKEANPTDANDKGYREDLARCRADVDAAMAAGAPSTARFELGSGASMRLDEVKPKLCDAFEAVSKQMTDRVKVEKERVAKVRAKYQAAGASGEKLDMLVSQDDAWYGPSKSVISDPKALASARLLFRESHNRDRGIWTVQRFEFSGNALKQSTTAEYYLEPDGRYFR